MSKISRTCYDHKGTKNLKENDHQPQNRNSYKKIDMSDICQNMEEITIENSSESTSDSANACKIFVEA